MENYGHDKAGNEDESIVHYYASVGDAKVGRTCLWLYAALITGLTTGFYFDTP
jgi:hypothetical protein